MALEKLINESNRHYREHNRAVIHKKPTPVQIVNVDYPRRSKAKITEAYYRRPSTTDYNGVYRGRYVDFDVKETHERNAYPLKNVHAHQIEHLRAVSEHGGLAFLLVRLAHLDEVLLLPYEVLSGYLERAARGGRKSITFKELRASCLPVAEGIAPRLDYLSAVDRWLASKDEEGRP